MNRIFLFVCWNFDDPASQLPMIQQTSSALHSSSEYLLLVASLFLSSSGAAVHALSAVRAANVNWVKIVARCQICNIFPMSSIGNLVLIDLP